MGWGGTFPGEFVSLAAGTPFEAPATWSVSDLQQTISRGFCGVDNDSASVCFIHSAGCVTPSSTVPPPLLAYRLLPETVRESRERWCTVTTPTKMNLIEERCR